MGIEVDPVLNRENASTISAPQSAVHIRTLKTNEEVMIARHVRKVVNLSSPEVA